MGQSIKNRVFGSDIPPLIKKKIEARQMLAYKAPSGPNQQINPSAYPDERKAHYTFAELNEMNFGGIAELSSRTPFVRMWTSLNISRDILVKEMDKKAKEDWEKEKYKEVDGKLVNATNKEYKDRYIKKINDKFELHQWEKLPDSTKIYQIGNHVLNTLEVDPNTPRVTGDVEGLSEGITKGVLPYEQETDSNAFLKPPAGITGLSSETEGALGTIKKTTVTFVVHNFSDFESIYLRYFLKPGAQLFVDFGWDTAKLYDIEAVLEDESQVENKLFGGNGAVTLSAGDLETLVGHVVDFDSSVREDGGFDCSVTIMSKNMSLLSKAFDPKLKERVKYGLDIEALGAAVSGVLGDPLIYQKASRWGNDSKTEEELRQTLQIAATKLLGGMKVKLPGSPKSAASKLASEYGIFYAGTVEENMKLFINFGWFEDRFLNKEFGYSDDMTSLTNSDGDSVAKDEGSLKSKFNSKNSFATFSNDLRNAMRGRGFYEGAHFLYPETWGSEGHTYNTKLGMTPDEYLDPNIYGNHPKNANSNDEVYDPDGNLLNAAMFGMTDEEFQAEFGKIIKEITTDASQIPLRELFISADMIKESMDRAQSLAEFLKNIMDMIRDASGGLIDLTLKSNSYSQHTLSFVDRNNVSKSSNEPKDPGDLPEFLKELLVFKPYTRNTIVKEYELSFNMPQGGLGNMIAIQSAGHLNSSLSINKIIDGFVQYENLSRSPNKNSDNIFVRYNPSIGEEAGRRFEKVTKQQSAGTFSFSKDDIAYNQSNQTKNMLGEIKNSEDGFTDVSGLGKGASIDDFKDLISDNLNRAVDPKMNLDGTLIKPPTPSEDTIEDTKKSEQDLARNYGHELVNTPYEYHVKTATHAFSQTSNPIIPLEASLKIYGISSLVPGDLCRINYLPQNYLNNVYFQIIKVSHDVGTSWDTSLTMQMRICSMKKDTEGGEFRVRKSYLRNILKLKEIDSFIHLFGNLQPLDFDEDSKYIDNKFLCYTAATVDEDILLPALETSLNEDDTIESFKHFLGGEEFWGKDSKGQDFKGTGELKIHTRFNNYISPFGNSTGAIECTVSNFKHDPDPILFHLYTSGKNWMIIPLASDFKESWVDDIFMVASDKVLTSKLKVVKTAAKKVKGKTKEEIEKEMLELLARIHRSQSGINEYWGRETKGREESKEEYDKLQKKLSAFSEARTAE